MQRIEKAHESANVRESFTFQPTDMDCSPNLPQPDLSRLIRLADADMASADPAALALKALGAVWTSPSAKSRAKPDLVAATLRAIYALDRLPALPRRPAVRHALVCRLYEQGGGLFAMAAARVEKPFPFDALTRRVYLSFAGLEKGTVVNADEMLVKRAFHIEMMHELAAAIVREASKPVPAAALPPEDDAEPPLEDFALSVRGLARTMETRPYTGRVAIAQVYDAAVAKGLSLGSLDEFKERLAEAAREGLLDLERYDIAGPFEPTLKERSRLKLGRDERHFIVNQWN
jgi:hypothetical protein